MTFLYYYKKKKVGILYGGREMTFNVFFILMFYNLSSILVR